MKQNTFQALEDNIVETIKEQQLKIGYRTESVRLYYPLDSLNRFLERQCSATQMQALLQEFCEVVKERLGNLEISNQKSRFCFKIPEEGNAYVHEQIGENDFLADLIDVVQKHGCTMEQVEQTFLRYSDKVHVEKMEQEEFDYLMYFENGKPDSFFYCFDVEGCHIIYHRFTKADYEEMFL